MRKFSLLGPPDAAAPFVGIVKYYVIGATLGLLVVAGFAYGMLAIAH